MPYMAYMIPMMVLMGPMMYLGASSMGTKIPAVARYDQAKAYKGGARHLLWPGRESAPDPLQLARTIYQQDPGAYERGEIEWNYPAAIDYLRLQGKLEK